MFDLNRQSAAQISKIATYLLAFGNDITACSALCRNFGNGPVSSLSG